MMPDLHPREMMGARTCNQAHSELDAAQNGWLFLKYNPAKVTWLNSLQKRICDVVKRCQGLRIIKKCTIQDSSFTWWSNPCTPFAVGVYACILWPSDMIPNYIYLCLINHDHSPCFFRENRPILQKQSHAVAVSLSSGGFFGTSLPGETIILTWGTWKPFKNDFWKERWESLPYKSFMVKSDVGVPLIARNPISGFKKRSSIDS